MQKLSVSVVLPVVDELQNLLILIPRLIIQLENAYEFEILVIDDSSFPCGEILLSLIGDDSRHIRYIHRDDRSGLASAIEFGLNLARFELICWLDADLSMPPEILPKLFNEVFQGFDICIASRFIPGGGFKGMSRTDSTFKEIYLNIRNSEDSLLSVILSRILNSILRYILNCGINDLTSGYILAKKSLIKEVGITGFYGEYFPVLVYKLRQITNSIVEVPYICLPRVHGVSKTGTNLITYIRRGFPYITQSLKAKLDSRFVK